MPSRVQRAYAAGLAMMCGLAIGCTRSQEPATTTSQSAGNATQAAVPAAETGNSGGLNIGFKSNPDPPRNGDNAIEVTVTDRAGAPVTDAAVEAVFLMPPMPSMNMPAMRSAATLAHQGGGRYTGTAQMSMSGTWTTTITIARGGKQVATKRLSVNVN